MTRSLQKHRPALLAALVLAGLGICLLAHLWRTREEVRLVSPLPLAAPGYTLKDSEGANIRVIPLAGFRLYSKAVSDFGGESPQQTPRARPQTAAAP